MSLTAQSGVTLTFTCRTTDSLYVPPDYIVVENLDSGWVETIPFPDTVYQLILGLGVTDYSEPLGLVLSPNPFDGMTTVECDQLVRGNVTVEVTDLAGRVLVTSQSEVRQPGRYTFRITLSRPGVYLMNLRQTGRTASAKLVNTGCGGSNSVEVDGIANGYRKTVYGKSSRGNSTHPFQIGDQMRYVAYASDNASYEVVQNQYDDDTVTLVFEPFIELGDSLPCPGTPTVTDYDGNIYNTVKIGSQCWMKENLRTTHYADGTEIPLGGEIGSFTEPFYYDHPVTGLALEERGYLYNWPAVMNGESSSVDIPSGVQGVCPDGWHLPSDLEWGLLTVYTGSQSEYTCNGVGSYIGKALASQTSWPESPFICCVGHYPEANNATGFSIVSAGYCVGTTFDNAGAFFTTCTNSFPAPSAYTLSTDSSTLQYSPLSEVIGLSVRCLRN